MPQHLSNSITTIDESDASIRLRLRIWYNSSAGVSDSSNSFTVTGNWPGRSGVSLNISIPFNGGSQLIYDEEIQVFKTYGSSQSVSFNASLSGINYWGTGQTIRTSRSRTVSARPYVRPTAPGAPSVSRSSDTRHSLSWSRNPTTAGPYTSQRVRRRVYTAGSWGNFATRANVSGTATSYTDDATRTDRVFQYAIQAVNSAGHTSSEFSVFAFTTPATPSSVVATKLTSGDIRVRITPVQATPAVNFQIQHSTNDGSSWSALATVSGSRAVTDYVHVSPNPAQTHRYRVRVVVNASGHIGHGLASGWRTSANIQLAAPPLAPTITQNPGLIAADDLTHGEELQWRHNPVDSSDLSDAQIQYRFIDQGGTGPWGNTFWPDALSLDPPFATMELWGIVTHDLLAGETIEWQARTKGAHANWSPWSATASIATSTRPTAAVTSPEDGATVTDPTLTVEWEYFQAEDSPQASWRATLLDEFENTVEVLSGSGDTSQVTFATPVMDGQSYIVRVEVASAMGLWSEPFDVHFDVEYLAPGPVHITDVQWDRNSGAVVLALDPGDWDGIVTVEPIAVTVHRSNDGGETWEVVDSETPLGAGIASLVDTVPPTRGELLYRATAISELPSIAIGEPVAITVNETAYAYLGYGPGFSNILTFYGNLKRSTTASRDEVIQQFAGRVGANNRPAGVIISGEARSRDFGVTAALVMADGMATAEDFEEAAFHGGVMCLRTPDGASGRRVFGKISPVGTTSEYAPIEGVQFTISETERG